VKPLARPVSEQTSRTTPRPQTLSATLIDKVRSATLTWYGKSGCP
jgi:hypothetical protein